MSTLIVAEKKVKTPGIVDHTGTHVVSAVNHKLVKIGKQTFWQEGGIIHCTDEGTGQWRALTAKAFRSTLEILGDWYKHGLLRSEDRQYHGMKLEFIGIKDKEEIKKWYDNGMELIRDAHEHGAPEIKGGAEMKRARLPKWFRF